MRDRQYHLEWALCTAGRVDQRRKYIATPQLYGHCGKDSAAVRSTLMAHRIVPHLSSARLAAYRAECGNGSDHRAGVLYAWKLELHSAWWEVLGLVEMLLRHSVDNALGDWNSASALPGGGGRSWLVTAAKPLSSLSSKMSSDAIAAATKPPNDDHHTIRVRELSPTMTTSSPS